MSPAIKGQLRQNFASDMSSPHTRLPQPGPKRPPENDAAEVAATRGPAARTVAPYRPPLLVRHQLDLLYLTRALRSSAAAPTELRPALRRCIAAAKTQPRLLDKLLDALSTAAKESITVAARALTAVAEAVVMAAHAEGHDRVAVSRSDKRVALDGLLDVASEGGLERLVDALAARRSSAQPVARKMHDGPGQPPAAQQATAAMVALADAYEDAAAACTAACVGSAAVTPKPDAQGDTADAHSATLPPKAGAWVTARAPARIDLAGGWTDTPPICYEAGGRVVNLAVTVGGRRPIGARARRLAPASAPEAAPCVRLHMHGAPIVIMTCLDDLNDCCLPHAPGALVKAVLVVLGALDRRGAPLATQLAARFGGGIEIEAWSELPMGSVRAFPEIHLRFT